MAARMTIKEARAICRQYGCTLTSRPCYHEYRVNLIGGKEASAYYTNDLHDAIATARMMNTVNRIREGK
jgi:hypothetical protein